MKTAVPDPLRYRLFFIPHRSSLNLLNPLGVASINRASGQDRPHRSPPGAETCHSYGSELRSVSLS